MEEEGMKLEVKYPENYQLRLSEHITVDINQRSRSPINLDNIQKSGYKASSVDILAEVGERGSIGNVILVQ